MTKGLSAYALAIMGALSASAAQSETLVVTTNLNTTHWASIQGGEPFLACVKERTNGEIDFEYYHSGQLASFFESLNAVNSGLAQMSYIVLAAQSDKLPLTGLSMLPGLGKSVVEVVGATRAALDGEGLISQEYAANNIVPLMINVFPAYQMVSRVEALDSLEAIKGKRISSGGGPLLVTLAAVGAAPVESATSDVYVTMQQGTVDGSMLSLASVQPYNLHEVMSSTSFNGNFGVAIGIWSLDRGLWDGLDDKQRQAFRDCGLEVEQKLARWTDDWLSDVRLDLESKGVTVFDYAPEELAKIDVQLERARQEYIARLSARGLPAQEAYNQYIQGLAQ